MKLTKLTGKISLIATVYVNAKTDAGNGLDYFMHSMEELGVDISLLVNGEHYVINKTAYTEFLRPYTGDVLITADLDPEAMKEVAPLIIQRDSHPVIRPGSFRVYNNLLFRACIRLGVWSNAMLGGFAPVMDLLDETELASLMPMVTTQMTTINEKLKATRAEEKKVSAMAKAFRNTVFKIRAAEYSKEAIGLRKRILSLESDLAMMESAFETVTLAASGADPMAVAS